MEKDAHKSKKDEILGRSPLLSVFVNSAIKDNYLAWLKSVDNEFLLKRDEMVRILGDELIDRDLNIFFQVANDNNVFRPDISTETKFALIACFTWMGFEIGNTSDVALFLDDVMNRLDFTDALTDRPENKDYIAGIMKCGANWRDDILEDVQDVWKNAIGKLKF